MYFSAHKFLFVPLLWSPSISFVIGQVQIDRALTIILQGNPGGCSPGQVAQINQWWGEAYMLATTALAGIDSYAQNQVVRNSLKAFFAVNYNPQDQPASASDLAVLIQIRSFYQAVQNYLAQGITIRANYPTPGFVVPPANIRLYCNSDFLQFKEKGSQAKDTNGDGLTTNGQLNGPPLAIQNVPQYQGALAAKYIGEEDANGNEILTPQFPYWFAGPNSYFFNKKFSGDPPSYCADDNYGFTENSFISGTNQYFVPFVVTLCPITFIEGVDAGGQRNLAGNTPVIGGPLNDYASQGMTLFHELFHLVLGPEFTPDNELFDAEDCLENALDITGPSATGTNENSESPECLTQWANSYYYATRVFGTRAGTGGGPNMGIHYQFVNGKAVGFEIPLS